MLKKIAAKFKSHCHETGTEIKKGENCIYNSDLKKVYSLGSQTGLNFYLSTENKTENLTDFIEDPAEQYFENFCINNNI